MNILIRTNGIKSTLMYAIPSRRLSLVVTFFGQEF